jgi:hypothetical protein
VESVFWSGNLVTEVGDLYKLYPNKVNFSSGVRLRSLKIGSDTITTNNITSNYENNNLTSLEIKSPLLEYLDCRNCVSLTGSIDLKVSKRLQTALFEGTHITSLQIPAGCLI